MYIRTSCLVNLHFQTLYIFMGRCKPLSPNGVWSFRLTCTHLRVCSVPCPSNSTMSIDNHNISIIPTRSGTTAGNHCCYRRGDLCTDSECGGTVDKVTPQNWTTYLQHTMEDVLPAVYCCKGTFTNCDSYQQKRPIDDGSRSSPPPPVPGKQ